MNFKPALILSADAAMVGIIQENVQSLRGFKPQPIVSLGGTDARLWRYRDIPTYVYGPFPTAWARPTSSGPGGIPAHRAGASACRRMTT